MDDIKKWVEANTALAFGIMVVVVVLVIVVFYLWLKDDAERMMEFKINTGMERLNGGILGNTNDPRFNLMKADKSEHYRAKKPHDKPDSNVYALGQVDYDWLTWRPAHIRELEQKERSVNIMREPITAGGYDGGMGARDIYSRADYAMHPANRAVYGEHMQLYPGVNPFNQQRRLALGRPLGWGAGRTTKSVLGPSRGLATGYSRSEQMDNQPVAQNDNVHVFRGPPGDDVTVLWTPPPTTSNLNNQGQWGTELTTNPDEDIQLQHAQRELELAQALYS